MDSLKEKMFFLVSAIFQGTSFVMPAKEEESLQENIWHSFRICFDSVSSGCLYMTIGDNLLKSIHENMTSNLESEHMITMDDSAKELLNIVCGNLLPEFFSKKTVYNLKSPEKVDKIEHNSFCCENEIFFIEGRVRFKLFKN